MSRPKWAWCLILWTAAAAHGEGPVTTDPVIDDTVTDDPVTENTVTEEEYLSALTRGHPAIIAQSDRLGVAQAARRTAAAFQNPDLEFEREAPTSSAQQSTWRLAWTPPLDGRRRLSVEVAGVELAAAEKDLDSTHLRLRSRMRAAYSDWVLSSERDALLSSHLALIGALAERMATRAAGGEESLLASRRMDLVAAQVRADLSLQRAALARARATALAWRPDLDPALHPVPPRIAVAPAELDLSSRSDLEARRFELEGAEIEAKLARRFVLFPELHFGWQTIEGRGFRDDGPVFGVRWSVPLVSRGQAGRLGAMRRREVLEARLSTEVARAEGQLEGAQKAFYELAAAASRAATMTEDLEAVVVSAEAAYRFGESSVTDLLDSLRSVLSTRLSSLELYAAALEAHRSLEFALGRPLATGDTP